MYGDPVTAAKRKSYFPAVNMRLFDDRTDLAHEIESSFYGGGNAPPMPTPTPVPSAPSWWHFWGRPKPTPTPSPRGLFMNQQMYGLGLNRFPLMQFNQWNGGQY